MPGGGRPIFQQQVDPKKRDAELKKQGKNPDGSPIRSPFQTLIGKDGNVKKQFQLKQQAPVQLNTQGLDALRQRGLAQGPSAWANMMNQKQGLEQAQAMDDMAAQGAGARSQAMADLAERGGLSDQARENLAMQQMRNQQMGGQQVSRQGQLDRMNIGLQDEQQKLGILQNLPGQELAALEPQFKNQANAQAVNQFNIGQSMGEWDKKRMADENAYLEKLKQWGAGKAADAQAKAAGGGGKK